MTWLKRNLVLVVGGALAVILLGAAGFFLYSGYGKDRAVSNELQQAVQEFSRLNTRAPSANEQNIEAAITEQKRLDAILQEIRRHFVPFGTITNIDSSEFKYLLANTIDELERMAENYGVRRPNDFAYTFDKQRNQVSFQEHDLLPWTDQLLEIRALTEIIYRARVHSLLRIRRASSSTNDTTDYVLRGLQPVTNHVAQAVTTPYEIVFQGFTPELAEVLNALAHSPQCYLVKNLNVERSTTQATSTTDTDPSISGRYGMVPQAGVPQATTPEQNLASRYGLPPGGVPGGPGSRASAEAQMASRYGLPGAGGRGGPGGRYGGRPGAPVQPMAPTPNPYLQPGFGAPARRGPETVLDEQLLRFTMRLDVVRPLLAAK
jgi:hypothetical protein